MRLVRVLPIALSLLASAGLFHARAATIPPAEAREDSANAEASRDRALLDAVPETRWRSAREIAEAWASIRRLGDPKAQAAAIREGDLRHAACTGLVDFAEVAAAHGLRNLRRRDTVRGRTWMGPVYAKALLDTLMQLESEAPKVLVSIGDAAQPGCGPLDHGTMMRRLVGADAEALLSRASWRLGLLTVDDDARASEMDSGQRFGGPDDLIRVERAVIRRGSEPGSQPVLQLGVRLRRYRRTAEPTGDEVAAMWREAVARIGEGVEVEREQVRHTDAEGAARQVWVQRWVVAGRKRQVVTASYALLEGPVSETLAPGVVDVRLAGWDRGKPDSYPDELRWSAGEAGGWARWRLLPEASHQSHADGRDADISYLTRGNAAHFLVAPKVLDTGRSWRFWNLLDHYAREAGSRIELLLVGKQIGRRLRWRLSAKKRRTPLWRFVIRRASGHDSHAHIRLARPSAEAEAKARAALAPPAPAAPVVEATPTAAAPR